MTANNYLSDLNFKKLLEGFKIYDTQLVDNKFTYSYEDSHHYHQEIVVYFQRSNFMHLCGVTYKYGANNFYRALKAHKISLHNVFTKSDGTTQQKLQVINNLSLLLTPNVRVTDGGIFINLRFDKALRTNKDILALTCVKDNNNYAPQSLLALHMGNKSRAKVFMKNYQVLSLKKQNMITKQVTMVF